MSTPASATFAATPTLVVATLPAIFTGTVTSAHDEMQKAEAMMSMLEVSFFMKSILR